MKRILIALPLILPLAVLAGWFAWPDAGREIPPPEPVAVADEAPKPERPLVVAPETGPEGERLQDITTITDLAGDRLGLDDPSREARPSKNKIIRKDEESDQPASRPRSGFESGDGKLDVPAEATPALHWLSTQQHIDGYFPGATSADEPQISYVNTSLVMFANARIGATHKAGPTRQAVRQAVMYTRKVQDNDGSFGPADRPYEMVQNAMTTLSVVETYGVSADQVLKPVADKGIEYLLRNRSEIGGWGMKPKDAAPNATATGWALLALWTAKRAGLEFDEQVFEDVALWAWSLRRNGFTAWSTTHERMQGATGACADDVVADAVLVLALHYGGYMTIGDPSVELALERLRQPVQWEADNTDLMAWFFTAHVLKTVEPEAAVPWLAATLDQLNNAAIRETDDKGQPHERWTSEDHWSRQFGPVYTTAVASIVQALCNPAD